MKGRPRKYPKTTGHYCYCHILPNEMFYIGCSGQQPSKRWKPSHYKSTSLQPGIEEFGWENIRHVVLKDGLTKEQAEQLEDLLIQEATRQGFCLNERRSGGRWRDNRKNCMFELERSKKRKNYRNDYYKVYRQKEEYKKYNREYQRKYRLKKKQGI